MASKVVITKKEFDDFWEEVIGDDWCIDEWNIGDDEWEAAGPDDFLTITEMYLEWQSLGNYAPKPNQYLTAARINSGNFLAALRAWQDKKAMRHVSAHIPSETVEEFHQFVRRVGGTL